MGEAFKRAFERRREEMARRIEGEFLRRVCGRFPEVLTGGTPRPAPPPHLPTERKNG